ncbi:MAG: hypothetical protein MZW92_71655 [Comamonadaceae bacterium]|nr:hypothetical protein [Comamonadaceae bacterium]
MGWRARPVDDGAGRRSSRWRSSTRSAACLTSPPDRRRRAHRTLRGSLALFRQPPILLCFAFFAVLTDRRRSALQTFAADRAQRGVRRADARSRPRR